MVRFYFVKCRGKPIAVELQTETGLYTAVPQGGKWQRVSLFQVEKPEPRWVKLPEWSAPRQVLNTSAEYFEFKNRMEGGSYADIVHSPVETVGLSVEEAALLAARRIEPDAVLV